jgi:hypothetical protein
MEKLIQIIGDIISSVILPILIIMAFIIAVMVIIYIPYIFGGFLLYVAIRYGILKK